MKLIDKACGVAFLGASMFVTMACSSATSDLSVRTAAQTACIVENDAAAPARACYEAAQQAFCAKQPSDPTCTDGGVE